jgi:hypothetical protein
LTSRTATTGICHPSGSRGEGKQYNSRTKNLFPPLPAGSIRGAFLEKSNPLHPSLHKFLLIERALLVVNGAAALVFALYLLFAKLP